MTTIYFAGGEDTEFYTFTGSINTGGSSNYRTTYARCALDCGGNGWWNSRTTFTASTFWFSGRVMAPGGGGTFTSGGTFIGFFDGATYRLGIQGTGSSTCKVVKVDNSGTSTQLGSTFSFTGLNTLSKIDVFVNYNASGTVTIYQGGIQLFTYSGDVTTNSATTLSRLQIGSPNLVGANNSYMWSELIVADTDTRSWSLQTLAPVANGNTHNFDTGTPAAANVNEITLNTATLDGSTTAGQIDQYTIPAIASGTFSIIAVGVSSFMQKGATGPSKMDLGVRSGGADFWSSDQVLTTTWDDYINWWTTDPNTSSSWASLPTNIGLKSVT